MHGCGLVTGISSTYQGCTYEESQFSLSYQPPAVTSSSAKSGSFHVLPQSMPDCWLAWPCPGLVQASTVAVSSWVFHPGLADLCPLQSLYLFHRGPWALSGERMGVGCDINVPLRAEYCTDTYSLHIDWLWFSVLISVYYAKSLLWWGMRTPLIYGCKDTYLVDILISCPFSKIKAVGFSLGPLIFLATSAWLNCSTRHEFLPVEQSLTPTRRHSVTPVTFTPVPIRRQLVTPVRSHHYHTCGHVLPGQS
jgi:hypothetical protein